MDSSYWGRILVAMVLMSAGLALTSSPATEAIMGALPAAKAGAGSAVNDTTRELGGTLGVAIVGSVMSSAYASHVMTALSRIGAPASVTSLARQSVVAGLRATELPAAQLARGRRRGDPAGLRGRPAQRLTGRRGRDRPGRGGGPGLPARPSAPAGLGRSVQGDGDDGQGAQAQAGRWAGLNRSCRTSRASMTVTPGYKETSTAAMASMLKCVA